MFHQRWCNLKFGFWFTIRHPFSRRNICRTTGVGAYAGHVARPKYYENLSWGPHYTETICHPLGIHLKPFTDVSGHKTAQKLSKIKKNGWQNFNNGGIYFFFLSTSWYFFAHFFSRPILGNPFGLPMVIISKAFKKSGLQKQYIEFFYLTKQFVNFLYSCKDYHFYMA